MDVSAGPTGSFRPPCSPVEGTHLLQGLHHQDSDGASVGDHCSENVHAWVSRLLLGLKTCDQDKALALGAARKG